MSQSSLRADTVRITTWNLQSWANRSAALDNQRAVGEVATTLKRLEPDVILLQGVRDWQMCADLIETLKPGEYNILICSSFPGSDAQVAILSRQKAYFSWSEPFRAETAGSLGGFAFAAIQLPRHRLGVFSVAFENSANSTNTQRRIGMPHLTGNVSREPPEPDSRIQQILSQADAVKHWQLNQVQAVLFGATFSGAPNVLQPERDRVITALASAGFADGLLLMPSDQRATLAYVPGRNQTVADYFFVDAAAFATNPKIIQTPFVDHFPLICDLETEPARAALLYREQTDQLQAAAQLAARAGAPPAQFAQLHQLWWLAAAVGGFIVVLAIVWVARRSGRALAAPLLLPENARAAGPSSYTLVIAPGPATGSVLEASPDSSETAPMVRIEPAGSTQTQSAFWQQRAQAAEQRADRAQTALKHSMLPGFRRWLRQKLTRKLLADRAGLIENQEIAARKALNVDERLARIEHQLQQQNRAYERRIEELTCELMTAREENRELIRARIAQVRAEMEAAQAKLLARAEKFPPNEGDYGLQS